MKLKTAILDITKFFKFRKQFKKFDKQHDIEFKSLGLNTNKLGNIVYCQIDCTDEELKKYEYSPLDMVMNKIKPQIDFRDDHGYGDYIVPQINNFVDDDGNHTLSYLVLFMYYPQYLTITKLLHWIVGIGCGIGLFFIAKWLIETYI
jgi:hypothetical protein